MPGADRYIGGATDNVSWFSPVNADASSSWDDAPSGDGFEAVWHYEHPDSILESSNPFVGSITPNIQRTTNSGFSWHSASGDITGFSPFIVHLAKTNIDPD